MREQFSSRLVTHLESFSIDDAIDTAVEEFLNNSLPAHGDNRYIGFIAIIKSQMEDRITNGTFLYATKIELWYSHTTPSFCLGYASDLMKHPKSLISRLDDSRKKKVCCLNL